MLAQRKWSLGCDSSIEWNTMRHNVPCWTVSRYVVRVMLLLSARMLRFMLRIVLSVVLRSVALCSVALGRVALACVVLYCVASRPVAVCCCIVLCCAVLCCAVRCVAVRCGAVRCGVVRRCAVLRCTHAIADVHYGIGFDQGWQVIAKTKWMHSL